MSKVDNVSDFVRGIADTIRFSNGIVGDINPQNFGVQIKNLPHRFAQLVGGTITSVGEKDMATLTEISNQTFRNCESLTDVTVPNNITNIASFAFLGCYSLLNITIPNGVTNIGANAFNHCESLENLTIPTSVTTIGVQAFMNCSNLRNIQIPSGVERLEIFLLGNCTSLETIVIPDTATYIAANMAKGCSSLRSITINAVSPPTLSSSDAFLDTNNCPIYVPAESVATYKAATNWVMVADRIEAISE